MRAQASAGSAAAAMASRTRAMNSLTTGVSSTYWSSTAASLDAAGAGDRRGRLRTPALVSGLGLPPGEGPAARGPDARAGVRTGAAAGRGHRARGPDARARPLGKVRQP